MNNNDNNNHNNNNHNNNNHKKQNRILTDKILMSMRMRMRMTMTMTMTTTMTIIVILLYKNGISKTINLLETISDNKDLVKSKSKFKINKKKNKEIKIEKPIIAFSIKHNSIV